VGALVSLAATLCPAAVAAQPPRDNGAVHRAAIDKLGFLVGEFTGEGTMVLGAGERATFAQTERVRRAAGGTVLVIDGLGRSSESGGGRVVHDAHATISWREETQSYVLRSHLATGHGIETWLKVANDTVTWGFDSPGGAIVYTINVRDGVWHEVGDITLRNGMKQRFIEIRVRREGPATE